MARLPWRRTTTPAVDPDVVKAAPALPAGTVAVTVDPKALLDAIASPASSGPAQSLPQSPWDMTVPFGPGVPIRPSAIDPLRPDSRRPEPRLYQYEVSANLPGSGQRLLPWKVLRDAADQIGLVRRCIEIRKDHIANADWCVRVSKGALARAQGGDKTTARRDVEQQMREKLGPQITAAEDFLHYPDRGNGLPFADWMKGLLEEHFVLDAIAIYPRRTLGGDLYSLEVVDGSTIKPLLDHRGSRPLPPHPAYQQILHGFPRGEFVASVRTDADGEGGQVTLIPGAYRSDELIYRRRNVRSWTPYGFSAVEQCLTDAETWLRRMGWIRAEYTDGVMPSGWLLVDGTAVSGAAAWSPSQTLEYESVINGYLSGDTRERHRFKVLPPGLTPADGQTGVEGKYRPDYDLFLLKLVATHFDVTPPELGFMESGGLGGASYHEGQEDVQNRKTRPLETWVASVITELMHTQLGMAQELEFAFLGEESEDEDAADEVADRRVKTGRQTLNEDRDRQGLPRYNFPEADLPMYFTATGVEPLEGIVERQQQQAEQAAKLADAKANAPQLAPGQPARPAAAAGKPKPKATAAEKADELRALRAYARSREGRPDPRPFVCKVLTADDLTDAQTAGDITDIVHRLAKAADGGDAGARDHGRGGGLDGLGGTRAGRRTVLLPYQPGC